MFVYFLGERLYSFLRHTDLILKGFMCVQDFTSEAGKQMAGGCMDESVIVPI